MYFERLAQVVDVVVSYGLVGSGADAANAREVWAVVLARLGVCGHGDRSELEKVSAKKRLEMVCTCSPSVKVLRDREDQCLILRYAFDLISPFARNLDCCLHCLGACVHRQDHVEAKQLGRVLGEAWEDIVVERSAAEGQARCLLSQCLDELGVAVALVYGRVGGEEVEVVFSFRIPDAGTACARED